MGNIYMYEHLYEKIKSIEQFCVFWYITMTMKFHLFFLDILTNQVHNIFYEETYILIYAVIKKILIFPVNNICHLLEK